MKKVFLCTLIVFGFMNLSFGQLNKNRISVKTYDSKGLLDQFMVKGTEALSFDIPGYIKDNEDLERIVIVGTLRSTFLTTSIKFDSNSERSQDAQYVCKDVDTRLTPFLGVWGTTANKDLNGVDIKRIIPETSASLAGIVDAENIIEFDGIEINSFPELKKVVLSSQIGDRIEVKLQSESNSYSKYVTLGSRGIKTINYKYCTEEPIESVEERNLDLNINNVSFNVFPNPTRSMTSVNFKSESDEDVIFSVINIEGRLIHKEVVSNFKGDLNLSFNLANRMPGTYIFRILQGKEVYNHKVQMIK